MLRANKSLDLNIPILAFVSALFIVFLHVPTPPGTVQEKLKRIDWM
jgi:hypothetical protein